MDRRRANTAQRSAGQMELELAIQVTEDPEQTELREANFGQPLAGRRDWVTGRAETGRASPAGCGPRLD